MITILGPQSGRTCDGVSRRSFLRLGALGLGGLTLADLFRLQARGAVDTASAHKAVILVYLPGGPSHIDMYDLKPDAPAEIRGTFKPVATNVAGTDVCEWLPLHTQLADKFAILRGLKLSGSHGSTQTFTGFMQPGRPGIGSVVSRLRPGTDNGIVPYVRLGTYSADTGDTGEVAYLGAAHRPFTPRGQEMNNMQMKPGMTLERFADRKELLRSFDNVRRDLDARGEMAGVDTFAARALDMIASPKIGEALDVSREPAGVRARYGANAEQLLVARRLVQAGVSVVTVSFGSGIGWDTHQNNFQILKNDLLPKYDQAVHALVTDLHERGLDKDVAVFFYGEMGRTPKINSAVGRVSVPGRDHWPTGAGLVVGGGLKMGQVVGATGSDGGQSKGRPYNCQNLLATMYHVLGIDPASTLPDQAGRPQYLLSDCEKIAELL